MLLIEGLEIYATLLKHYRDTWHELIDVLSFAQDVVNLPILGFSDTYAVFSYSRMVLFVKTSL